MTIEDFLNKRVRPSIGDTLTPPLTANQPPLKQMTKYDTDVLLDFLNEGILDITENSSKFVKTGYALLKEGDTRLSTPKDFKGFYKAGNASAGEATDLSKGLSGIHLLPDIHGIGLKDKITERTVQEYQSRVTGIALPTEIINVLVEAGQITIPAGVPMLIGNILVGRVLVEYEYIALPKEYSLTDTIEDRDLMYLLKWWVASHALYADMHNEAQNLAKIYEGKYLRRLDKAGQMMHNWNEVSLTPYTPRY